jgi:hypothetical protein
MTETEQLENRAQDAVSRCLLRFLTVPKVYFDREWAEPAHRVDILAIDRAGSGDVHVVEIKRDASAAIAMLPQIHSVPGTFKWVAVFADTLTPDLEVTLNRSLLPVSGKGRVGLIKIIGVGSDEIAAFVAIKSERFSDLVRDLATRFVESNPADIEVGGPDEPVFQESNGSILSNSDIDGRLGELKDLESNAHFEAAFLLAWTIAEALLRRAAEEKGEATTREPPTRLLRLLKSYQLLTAEEESALLNALSVRNQIAHGFVPLHDVASELRSLIELLPSLRQRLSQYAAH